MAIEVAKVELKNVQDASGMEAAIKKGQFAADEVIAVIGKTEGNAILRTCITYRPQDTAPLCQREQRLGADSVFRSVSILQWTNAWQSGRARRSRAWHSGRRPKRRSIPLSA